MVLRKVGAARAGRRRSGIGGGLMMSWVGPALQLTAQDSLEVRSSPGERGQVRLHPVVRNEGRGRYTPR